MGYFKKLSTMHQRSFTGKGAVVNIHAGELMDYVHHLQTVSYNEMNNGLKSIARQSANDVKAIYMALTPQRTSGGATGKYGATPGNLKRSLRIYQKRQRDAFIVEFSVGYRLHRGVSKKDIKNDGYYGFMVSDGVAGRRPKAKTPSIQQGNIDFINRAKKQANKQIEQGLSERALRFINNKLERHLIPKKHGMSAKQYAAMAAKYQ